MPPINCTHIDDTYGFYDFLKYSQITLNAFHADPTSRLKISSKFVPALICGPTKMPSLIFASLVPRNVQIMESITIFIHSLYKVLEKP